MHLSLSTFYFILRVTKMKIVQCCRILIWNISFWKKIAHKAAALKNSESILMVWVLLLNQIEMGARKKTSVCCQKNTENIYVDSNFSSSHWNFKRKSIFCRVWIFADKLETLKLRSVWRACKSLTLVPIGFCIAENKDCCNGWVLSTSIWENESDSKLTDLCTLTLFEPCFKHVQQVTFKLSSVFKYLKGGCINYATTVILRWRLFLPLTLVAKQITTVIIQKLE